jgi:hypothetical protein
MRPPHPLPCLAFSILTLFPHLSTAQCVATRGSSANFSSALLTVSGGFSSLPSTLQTGIANGADAWNSSSCNQGGDDFPRFALSGSGSTNIALTYSLGIGAAGFPRWMSSS